MRILINLSLAIFLIVGLVVAIPAQPAQADCSPQTGSAADETFSCDTTTDTDGGSDPATDTDGLYTGGGSDTVTVTAGATVESGVLADEQLTITNSGTILGNTAIEITGDGIVTNTETGLIQSDDTSAVRIDSGGPNESGSVFNSGIIIGYSNGVSILGDSVVTNTDTGNITGTFGSGVRLAASGPDERGDVTNAGTILGDGFGVIIDGDGTVSNATTGLIQGTQNDGIYLVADGPNTVGSVTNDGEISGAGSGIYVQGDGSVINGSTGYILGTTNDGVYFDGGNALFATVTNAGTIEGGNNGVYFNYDGTVINSGQIYGDTADGVYADGDTLNGTAVINTGLIAGNEDGIDLNSVNSLVINSAGGVIVGQANGIEFSSSATVINAGTISGNFAGVDFNSGAGYLYNNGSIVSANTGIDGTEYNDFIQIGDEGVVSAGSEAMRLREGDDTVVLGDGNVHYSTSCGDITQAVAPTSAPVINGLMYGEEGQDTLIFNLVIPNGTEIGTLDPASGSLSDGQGGSYDWNGFETLIVNTTNYSAGPARLYDDGVVLAFASEGGVVVCSGEAGIRAASADFAALDAGQRVFNAGNGWSIRADALGGGRYQVHLFDSAGIEHFNDADADGNADSAFIFTH